MKMEDAELSSKHQLETELILCRLFITFQSQCRFYISAGLGS